MFENASVPELGSGETFDKIELTFSKGGSGLKLHILDSEISLTNNSSITFETSEYAECTATVKAVGDGSLKVEIDIADAEAVDVIEIINGMKLSVDGKSATTGDVKITLDKVTYLDGNDVSLNVQRDVHIDSAYNIPPEISKENSFVPNEVILNGIEHAESTTSFGNLIVFGDSDGDIGIFRRNGDSLELVGKISGTDHQGLGKISDLSFNSNGKVLWASSGTSIFRFQLEDGRFVEDSVKSVQTNTTITHIQSSVDGKTAFIYQSDANPPSWNVTYLDDSGALKTSGKPMTSYAGGFAMVGDKTAVLTQSPMGDFRLAIGKVEITVAPDYGTFYGVAAESEFDISLDGWSRDKSEISLASGADGILLVKYGNAVQMYKYSEDAGFKLITKITQEGIRDAKFSADGSKLLILSGSGTSSNISVYDVLSDGLKLNNSTTGLNIGDFSNLKAGKWLLTDLRFNV